MSLPSLRSNVLNGTGLKKVNMPEAAWLVAQVSLQLYLDTCNKEK
jgi:hypothetical protein